MAESGVEEKHIDASKNGNLPDVPELKCYIKCLLEHSGMMEEDGTIHFNDVYHLLTPSMKVTVDKVVKECETKRIYNLFLLNIDFSMQIRWFKINGKNNYISF